KNIYGRGVKIGFVDSGLDYRHPAFGGCFKTCKSARVIAGYDFVGDAYTGANDPLPDSDPLDTCNGHGTHVTGIAAGNDGDFQGVAPKAQIGAYRVLGCTGTTQTGIVISALL
ncbi:peptidase S8/S53 domain-containing protein, partial [Dimargaris cristalligena]